MIQEEGLFCVTGRFFLIDYFSTGRNHILTSIYRVHRKKNKAILIRVYFVASFEVNRLQGGIIRLMEVLGPPLCTACFQMETFFCYPSFLFKCIHIGNTPCLACLLHTRGNTCFFLTQDKKILFILLIINKPRKYTT